MSPQDPFKDDNKEQEQYAAAIGVLSNFLNDFIPAENNETADTLLSSKEIVHAIEEISGVTLAVYDIFETLTRMNFKYSTINNIEFQWLLKKV